MDQVTLAFQERTELKKSASRRLRDSGRIPAVVYGQGKSALISVDSRDFLKRFSTFGENTVIKLENGKAVFEVLVKDYQDDILTGRIKHIDFYQVSATRTLHAKIPVHLNGNAVGIRNGGLMEHLVHEIEVECLAKDLPHQIAIDVSELDVGASVHVRDLPLLKNVKILTHEDTVIAHVINTKNLNVEPTPVVEAAPAAEAVAAAPAPEKKA